MCLDGLSVSCSEYVVLLEMVVFVCECDCADGVMCFLFVCLC